ncbi:MAG: hypothetical protein ACRERC_12620 [Candidatus Binatia bacterium]
MKNPDVRGTCLALIKSRLGGPSGGRAPRAAALGWQLAQGDVSLAEMVALCDAEIDAAGADGRWTVADPLRSLLTEYGCVRAAASPTKRLHAGERPARGRSAPDVNGFNRAC